MSGPLTCRQCDPSCRRPDQVGAEAISWSESAFSPQTNPSAPSLNPARGRVSVSEHFLEQLFGVAPVFSSDRQADKTARAATARAAARPVRVEKVMGREFG